MTDLTDDVLTIRNLRDLLGEARTRNIELARRNADLERFNKELRAKLDATVAAESETDTTDESMTGETLVRSLRAIITDLRATIAEQVAEIGALNRQNIELRGAVDALLQPAPSELLAKNTAHPSRQ